MEGLGATYDVHVRFVVKRVVEFLLVLIELFLLGATGENEKKSAGGFNRQIFAYKGTSGRPSPIIFAWIVRPVNLL